MRAWIGRHWPTIRTALGTAVTTIVARILTLLTTVAVAPEVGQAVLGAMLRLTLSRSRLEREPLHDLRSTRECRERPATWVRRIVSP